MKNRVMVVDDEEAPWRERQVGVDLAEADHPAAIGGQGGRLGAQRVRDDGAPFTIAVTPGAAGASSIASTRAGRLAR